MKQRENTIEKKIENERKKALERIIDKIDVLLESEKKTVFTAKGREFPLTCGVDCMVAHSQHLYHVTNTLYGEIIQKNNYREEQAIAKLTRLFESYAKTMALFAELRQYYPESAARVERYIPALSTSVEHGEIIWNEKKKDI